MGNEKKKDKKKKNKSRGVISLYDNMYYASIVKNKSILAVTKYLKRGNFGIDFICSYQGDSIVYYYVITGLPRHLILDFKDRLRRVCSGDVCISFLTNINHHNIAWGAPRLRARLRTLRTVSHENRERDIDAYNIHENADDLERQEWIEASLLYLTDSTVERDRSTLLTSTIIVVSGTKGEDFDISIKRIEDYCQKIGLTIQRLLYDIPTFLNYISPFAQRYSREAEENISRFVLPDETLARFSSFTQGIVGTKGIYFGTDIYSKFPVLKEVKKNGNNAETWLVTGGSGSGKSVIAKLLVMLLSAKGYYGTIMDIEGFEYAPFAQFMAHKSRVEIVNLAEGQGRYFDPVEISDPVGIERLDAEAKTVSVNYTLAILKVLVGSLYHEDIWVDIVLNDGVSEAYKDMGVTEKRETWAGSKGKTLYDIYDTILRLEHFRSSEAYNEAIKKVTAILGKYFESDGTRNDVFKEKVVVSDIIDADLVVCSFGMAGKAPQTVDETQLALMQLGAAMFSHQRSIIGFSKGIYNYKLWEELQRWSKFPDADKTLGVALTGGRKLGDINIVVTNELSKLLDGDNLGVFDAINVFFCGAIGDEKVRREFCERRSIPHLQSELDIIARENKRVLEEESINGECEMDSMYLYAFLCCIDGVKYPTIKVELPEGVANSKLFT